MHKKAIKGKTFIGRFNIGDDLLLSLETFCRKKKIVSGIFWLIGAVQNIKLGYYDQRYQKYIQCLSMNKKFEISSCQGNISMKGKDLSVHAHITVSDLKGKTYGGHLLNGTKIFACEFFLQELKNTSLIRSKDFKTGLPLWK